MRLTRDNIGKYIDEDGDLNLSGNKEITHIDYIPNNLTWISISNSNVEEITCELPEGLLLFNCYKSKLKPLPLLPKSLKNFDGIHSNLPNEFQVFIANDNIKCNQLRKLQMINNI